MATKKIRIGVAVPLRGFIQLMATGDGCWDKVNFLEPAGQAAEQGEARFGPIINYVLNAHDAAGIVLKALEDAAKLSVNGSLKRDDVSSSIKNIDFTGLANPNPVRWNEKGDNLSAITKLNIIKNGDFEEIK